MALCDKFPDQFDKSETTIKSQNTRKYTEFEKLLAAPDIDAVFIVTPPFEHPRMLEAAIQAKKHIYCEKPIGVDVRGVNRAMAAGEEGGQEQDDCGRIPAALRSRISGGVQAHQERRDRRTRERARLLDRERPVHAQALFRSRRRKAAELVLLQGILRRHHRRAGLPQSRRPALVPGRPARFGDRPREIRRSARTWTSSIT